MNPRCEKNEDPATSESSDDSPDSPQTVQTTKCVDKETSVVLVVQPVSVEDAEKDVYAEKNDRAVSDRLYHRISSNIGFGAVTIDLTGRGCHQTRWLQS